MKLTVLEDVCIGCRACTDIADDIFEIDGDFATVIMDVIPEDKYDEANDAIEGCPVGAIVKKDEE